MRIATRLIRLVIVIAVAGALLAATVAAAGPYGRDILTANRSESEKIDLNQLDDFAVRSYIYDTDGNTISTLHGQENRMPVTLAAVPIQVQDAILAVEDADFYHHGGVNVKAQFRAMLENVSAGDIEQGGSTITQQLVKLTLLSTDQTFERKSKEAMLAIRVEQELTEMARSNGAPDPTKVAKDVILNKYLNTVYFGSGAYGVQAASETYWGKPVNELGWEEAAMLAALIANPTAYDPTLHPEAAKKQRQIALDRLAHLNKITPAEARSMGEAPLPEVTCKVSDAEAQTCGTLALPEKESYFAEEVKQLMLNDPKYNLGDDYETRYNNVFGGGLKVYTTLDPLAQAVAENVVFETVPANDKGVVGVLVSIESSTGAVRTMVGGPGFDQFKYNIATHKGTEDMAGGRQTGSSFKTFTLLTALEQGNVPNDTIGGGGSFPNPPQKPYQIDGPGGSLTSITTASSNGAFVRLNLVVGAQNVIDMAAKLGVTTRDMLPVPSLTLGTFNTTAIEMAAAYATIPNAGVHNPYYLIERIEDRNGNPLYIHTPSGNRALSQQTACLATQVLMENVRSGTGRNASLPRQQAAGKTGTTDAGADVRFVGSTPYLTTAVWMGNPLNSTDNIEVIGGRENFGGVFPARIWGKFNATYHENRTPVNFPNCGNVRGGRTVKGLGDNKLATGGEAPPSSNRGGGGNTGGGGGGGGGNTGGGGGGGGGNTGGGGGGGGNTGGGGGGGGDAGGGDTGGGGE